MSINRNEQLVSVIIPVYNVEPWLSECLDSIIGQTMDSIEIICVNDGSTDDSLNILQQYAEKDRRVKIINQENKGLSEARNAGAKVASGKYLYFMDSDDVLELNALKLCVENMERRNLELLCFNAASFGDDVESAKSAAAENRTYFRRVLDNEKVYSGQELFAELRENNSYISPVWACVLLRESFLKNNLWFHRGILHEDEPWMFAVLMSLSRCGCVNQILYKRRVRSGSIMQMKKTFSHVYGTFVGSNDVRKIISDHSQLIENDRFADLDIANAIRLQKNAIHKYRICEEDEQQKRQMISDPGERALFEQTIVYPALLLDNLDEQKKENYELRKKNDTLKKQKSELEIKLDNERSTLKSQIRKLKKENKRLKRRINKIKNSTSYHLGRLLTWLPRKIKRLFKRKPVQEPIKNILRIHPSEVSGNHIVYHFDVTGEWATYFNVKNRFEITYPFNVEAIPESIRIIPFIAQVLPVSWVCDAEIHAPYCDGDFCSCLDDVKDGYKKMYPMISFGGQLNIEKKELNDNPEQSGNPLVCFSGGVDSCDTTIGHIQEKPILISIWGSDVPSNDEKGWRPVESLIHDNAAILGLETMTIRSSFRKLLSERKLGQLVEESGDGWWHGFQHGLGIYCHMAPVAWALNSDKIYFASTHTETDVYTCASDPTIDNFVRFCGSRVIHDGYDSDRQQKISRIIDYSKMTGKAFPLHVCWKKKGGDNCCHCEKCWRTILGICAESADPRDYGFCGFDGFGQLVNDLVKDYAQFKTRTAANFEPIQKRLRETTVKEKLPEELTWLYDADFTKVEDGTLRFDREGKLVEPIWLLGTPEHNNMGDQCIADAEIHYLRTVLPDKQIIEISENELLRNKYSQLNEIHPSQIVFLHGGGNLGTLWAEPEMIRREVIQRLPDNPIIILPQSIWYSEDDDGWAAIAEAQKMYRGENILLCCRDKISFGIAKNQFDCKSILIPDMVMWESKKTEIVTERFGALTLFRRDKERKITDADKGIIEEALFRKYQCIEVDDTVRGPSRINKLNRERKIDDLLRLISSVECVVTDRLHGMVLCAITETPCVVLGNGYHKVEACYEWLKDLDYIRFINTIEELEEAITSVCSCTVRKYPDAAMREKFDSLSQHIENLKKDSYE